MKGVGDIEGQIHRMQAVQHIWFPGPHFSSLPLTYSVQPIFSFLSWTIRLISPSLLTPSSFTRSWAGKSWFQSASLFLQLKAVTVPSELRISWEFLDALSDSQKHNELLQSRHRALEQFSSRLAWPTGQVLNWNSLWNVFCVSIPSWWMRARHRLTHFLFLEAPREGPLPA